MELVSLTCKLTLPEHSPRPICPSWQEAGTPKVIIPTQSALPLFSKTDTTISKPSGRLPCCCHLLSTLKSIRTKYRFRRLRVSGFTLLEVMVVTAIIGTLSAIAIPNFISFREKGKVAVAVTDIRLIEKEIMNYLLAKNELPDSLEGMSSGERVDPWGNKYRYLRIEGGNIKGKGTFRKDHFMVPINTDYDLYSMGRDGMSQSAFTAKASRDDVVRANNGGFVGLVSDY